MQTMGVSTTSIVYLWIISFSFSFSLSLSRVHNQAIWVVHFKGPAPPPPRTKQTKHPQNGIHWPLASRLARLRVSEAEPAAPDLLHHHLEEVVKPGALSWRVWFGVGLGLNIVGGA